MTFPWSATGGTISGSGSQVTWTAPSTEGTYPLTCTVSNGKSGTAQSNVNVSVIVQEGTKKWEFLTSSWVVSSPAIGPDGTIYVGSSDNKLYAIKGSGRLAATPWPKFRQNLRNTGRRE